MLQSGPKQGIMYMTMLLGLRPTTDVLSVPKARQESHHVTQRLSSQTIKPSTPRLVRPSHMPGLLIRLPLRGKD